MVAQITESRVMHAVESRVTLVTFGEGQDLRTWKLSAVCRQATGSGRVLRLGDLSLHGPGNRCRNYGLVFDCPVKDYSWDQIQEMVEKALQRVSLLNNQQRQELLGHMVQLVTELLETFLLVMSRGETKMANGNFDATVPILQLTGKPVVFDDAFVG